MKASAFFLSFAVALQAALLSGLVAPAAQAATAGPAAATVEGVQMPAWLEREGRQTPLAPGMEVRAGDQLRTGAGARVLLRLSEGSAVKLGERGSLRLAELQPSRDVFRAAMSVLEGAFRFTTDRVVQQRKRDININLSQVTAGIRGTDLWGRSREDNQIVCLIEGRIEVGAQGEQAVVMDQPLQFYQRERGQTRPISFVPKAQLEEWAKETEIESGRGAARRGGRYQVILATADTQADALAVYDRVRQAGYAATIRVSGGEGAQQYAVRIANLPSQAEAQALAGQLKGQHGIAEPRVAR